MARLLLHRTGMRTLALLVALITAPFVTAHAQETEPPDGTRISSAQVSGLDLSRLSPGLQEEIGKLAGSPLDRHRLRELAARIETEQPRFVAALRVASNPEGGARVLFVIARIGDAEHQANINAKYLVEDVEVSGVPESALSSQLRNDLQTLKGKPLDSGVAERIAIQLKAAFPEHDLARRTVRGSQPGRIKLIFRLNRNEWSRWLRFEPLEANAIYHSDQGWGAKLPLTISGRDVRVVPYFAIDVGDDLIEEYGGFGLRLESRKLGTERLGFSFDWSTLDQTWRDSTLAALAVNPQVPALYRNRTTVTPLARFAISPRFSVSGGVSIAELDPVAESSSESRMANAAIGGLHFNQRWKRTSGAQHDVEAAFTVRAGREALQSDLVYERYLGQVDYQFRLAHHRVLVSGQFGGLTGEAPLFERFSLGDSRTLRGWDKYEIAAAGGDRMFSASLEYRYRALALFLDSGSVWDTGSEKRLRFSTGFGFAPGPLFMTVGFPLNSDEFRAVFTMGLRFPTSLVGVRK